MVCRKFAQYDWRQTVILFFLFQKKDLKRTIRFHIS